MGTLSDFVRPLFRQSRYIRPGGQEYFEHTALNIAKCPYTTGVMAGLFYQAATGAPLANILPLIIGGGIIQYLKSSDNDGYLQLRPVTKDKVIDKRPDIDSRATPLDYMRVARANMNTARFLGTAFSALCVADVISAFRTGTPIGQHVKPLIWGAAAFETMRFFRYREVVKGNWVIRETPPRQDEPLYPTTSGPK